MKCKRCKTIFDIDKELNTKESETLEKIIEILQKNISRLPNDKEIISAKVIQRIREEF